MKVVETIAKSLFNLFGLDALPRKPFIANKQLLEVRSHAMHIMHIMHPWQ